MEIEKVCKYYKKNVPFSELTTMKVGGVARFVCYPQTIKEFIAALELCAKHNISYFILGNGSNVLAVGDYPGVIICTKKFNRIRRLTKNKVWCQCGVLLSSLGGYCAELGLSGMEVISTIPGTVGGAAYMNAGAFGAEFGKLISSVLVFYDGKIEKLDKSQLFFQYRKSAFTNKLNCVILSIVIQLEVSTPELVLKRQRYFFSLRKSTQNVGYPSAGSVFKRSTLPAAKMIEECGLKGEKVGGALVSTIHAGFIVNTGNASSSDVLTLIKVVQDKVRAKFGEELELEIILLGG